MKRYSKMLKKIFGAATVCIAFGCGEVKADFETDLQRIAAWCRVKTDTGDAAEVVKVYKELYGKFKKDVFEECNIFRNKKDIALHDAQKPFCLATKGEAYVFEFGYQLWEYVKIYLSKAKESVKYFVDPSVEMLNPSCQCVFARRICGLVHFCIRNFAGRFGAKELFDTKDCDVNKNTATEIWRPFGRGYFCEEDVERSVFGNLSPFTKRLKNILEKKKYATKMGFLESEEEYEKRMNKSCLSGIIDSYDLMVCGLNDNSKHISEVFSMRRSGLAEVRQEDFDAFLERAVDNLEGVLEMQRSIQNFEWEREKKIQKNLGWLLEGKRDACKELDKATEDLRVLETKMDFVERCSQPRVIRMELYEIARTMDGSDPSCKKKCLEKMKRLQEEDKYRTEVEAARKKVVEAEQSVMFWVNLVAEQYEKLPEEEFAVSKEKKLIEYALGIEQCNAYLKAFFYLHTLLECSP